MFQGDSVFANAIALALAQASRVRKAWHAHNQTALTRLLTLQASPGMSVTITVSAFANG